MGDSRPRCIGGNLSADSTQKFRQSSAIQKSRRKRGRDGGSNHVGWPHSFAPGGGSRTFKLSTSLRPAFLPNHLARLWASCFRRAGLPVLVLGPTSVRLALARSAWRTLVRSAKSS